MFFRLLWGGSPLLNGEDHKYNLIALFPLEIISKAFVEIIFIVPLEAAYF